VDASINFEVELRLNSIFNMVSGSIIVSVVVSIMSPIIRSLVDHYQTTDKYIFWYSWCL